MKKSSIIQKMWVWPDLGVVLLPKVRKSRKIRKLKQWLGLLLPPAILIGVALFYRYWHDHHFRRILTEEATPSFSVASRDVAMATAESSAPRESQSLIEAVSLTARAHAQSLYNNINTFDNTSELSQLNRTADKTPFHCSDELWDILSAARRAYRETQGAFDITAGPLIKLWEFHALRSTYPEPEDVCAATALAGMDKIRFDDQARTVFFTRAGMFLDLSSMARRYALSQAGAMAENVGVRRDLIGLDDGIADRPLPPPGKSVSVHPVIVPSPVREEITALPAPLSSPVPIRLAAPTGFSSLDLAVILVVSAPLYGLFFLVWFVVKNQVGKTPAIRSGKKRAAFGTCCSVSVANADGGCLRDGWAFDNFEPTKSPGQEPHPHKWRNVRPPRALPAAFPLAHLFIPPSF